MMQRRPFNSLKSRITIAITGVLSVSLLIMTVFFGSRAKKELSSAIEGNAINLLGATKNMLSRSTAALFIIKKQCWKDVNLT